VANVRVVPPHGARARYMHRSLACRCAACTAANTRYMADYRRRQYFAREVRAGRFTQLSLPAELLPDPTRR
jgi:hypothetical protein